MNTRIKQTVRRDHCWFISLQPYFNPGILDSQEVLERNDLLGFRTLTLRRVTTTSEKKPSD